jgi:hypothetical protein
MSLSATPVRRLFGMLSALVLAAVGLLVMPLSALAASPAYPAPLVDPAVPTGAPVAQADPGIELASNSGSDFSIGLPLMIAALVLLVGLALLVMMTRPSKAKHYRR